jgi:CRP/FNR family nitrogen fixation transcriptional regulator
VPAQAQVAHPLAEAFAFMGASMNVSRNGEIYGEGEPADYVYGVVRGVVRTYKLLSDGRRQINAFFFPGEVFGLEAANEHRFTAEAVCDANVVFVKRSLLVKLAKQDCDVANALWMMSADDLRRAQEQMLLLGRKSAQERVAAFLLEMAKRAEHGDVVDLPMSRQDIADYLGLTIETVSRTLTALGSAEMIKLPESRRIRLCDKAALTRLNS